MHDCMSVQRLSLLVHGRSGSEVVNLIQHVPSGSEVVLVNYYGPSGSEVLTMPSTWPCRLRGFTAYLKTELTYKSYENLTTTNIVEAIAQKLRVEPSWLRKLVFISSYWIS